jgi:sugar lactone lactonase YvrE
VELLADEAEGVKLKLTDAVDIAEDGTIYFTDASYKYNLLEFFWDFLEGKPYGRAISYDPVTKETKVLAHDLYFANGVAVSPDQQYVVFCETFMYDPSNLIYVLANTHASFREISFFDISFFRLAFIRGFFCFALKDALRDKAIL